MSRSVVGYEGVGAKGSHEAFQTGEVSAPCREHQARVKELAIKLLGFFQIVSLAGKPIFDGGFVLGLLTLGDSHGAI
jgi:hypothetical protein